MLEIVARADNFDSKSEIRPEVCSNFETSDFTSSTYSSLGPEVDQNRMGPVALAQEYRPGRVTSASLIFYSYSTRGFLSIDQQPLNQQLHDRVPTSGEWWVKRVSSTPLAGYLSSARVSAPLTPEPDPSDGLARSDRIVPFKKGTSVPLTRCY